MKITVISAAYPPVAAGESEHCAQICARLAARGDTVTVITTQLAERPGALPYRVQDIMQRWGWAELPRLLRALRAAQPQRIVLIHSAWLYGCEPMVSYLASIVRRGARPPQFTTLLEIYDPVAPKTPSARLLRKLAASVAGAGSDYSFGTLLRDSDRVIVLSEKMRDQYLAHEPRCAARLQVAPPPPLLAIEVDDVPAPAGPIGGIAAGAALTLAYFGYVYPGKGVDTLLRAIRIAIDRGVPIRLLMVGGGAANVADVAALPSGDGDKTIAYVREIRRLVTELGLDQAVVWTGGYASGSSTPARHIASAELCVLPFDDGIEMSRSSVAVAAHLGVPLLSTRPARLESPFVDRANVLLCPPRDAAALAGAIGEIGADEALRKRLAAGSKQLAADWYGWSRCLNAIVPVD